MLLTLAMADVRDYEGDVVEEWGIERLAIEVQRNGLVAEVLKLSTMEVLKAMVVEMFPGVMVRDDLK